MPKLFEMADRLNALTDQEGEKASNIKLETIGCIQTDVPTLGIGAVGILCPVISLSSSKEWIE